jgi:hypothetical protein
MPRCSPPETSSRRCASQYPSPHSHPSATPSSYPYNNWPTSLPRHYMPRHPQPQRKHALQHASRPHRCHRHRLSQRPLHHLRGWRHSHLRGWRQRHHTTAIPHVAGSRSAKRCPTEPISTPCSLGKAYPNNQPSTPMRTPPPSMPANSCHTWPMPSLTPSREKRSNTVN